jgi:uncharacterized membrane protein
VNKSDSKILWVFCQLLSFFIGIALITLGIHLMGNEFVNIHHYRITVRFGEYHHLFAVLFLILGVVVIAYTALNNDNQ